MAVAVAAPVLDEEQPVAQPGPMLADAMHHVAVVQGVGPGRPLGHQQAAPRHLLVVAARICGEEDEPAAAVLAVVVERDLQHLLRLVQVEADAQPLAISVPFLLRCLYLSLLLRRAASQQDLVEEASRQDGQALRTGLADELLQLGEAQRQLEVGAAAAATGVGRGLLLAPPAVQQRPQHCAVRNAQRRLISSADQQLTGIDYCASMKE